ncbi:hypothetical protein EfmAA94_23900 [Enterococcus faecium]|nr:hypothetical protein EfmAA94_23900 [Enterococcus faecium]
MVSASSNTFLLSIIDSIKLLVKKSNNKHYILCCGNCGILSFVFLKKELILPLLVAGFIYYMFDPIVVFLEKHRIPRVFGFLLTFLVVIILVVLTVMNVVPCENDSHLFA